MTWNSEYSGVKLCCGAEDPPSRPLALHMARLDSHRIMDLSNSTCSECVIDCDDLACVDDRCTNQCIIVACDDPEHADTPCSEEICESACVDPKHCFLVSNSLKTHLHDT
jgi:hypothetical protein